MKVKSLVALAVVALTACSTTPPEQARETEVITDPPNARIELNGEYVGTAPIKIKLRQRNGDVVGEALIRAVPVEAALQPQTKKLNGPVVKWTGGADRVPEKLFFDLRRYVPTNAPNGQPAAASKEDAALQVTRVCEQGSELRLKFFDERIEALQKQNPDGAHNAEIEELKQLRVGEIALKRALATFTKYVLAGKPFAITTEQIQDSFSDSQQRVAYFGKASASLNEEHRTGRISDDQFKQQSELFTSMQQQDLFLQQTLTAFSQNKAAYEQQLAAQHNGQNQGGLWQQSGNNTFERLLNWAILAKMAQPQQPTVIIQNPNSHYHPSNF